MAVDEDGGGEREGWTLSLLTTGGAGDVDGGVVG